MLRSKNAPNLKWNIPIGFTLKPKPKKSMSRCHYFGTKFLGSTLELYHGEEGGGGRGRGVGGWPEACSCYFWNITSFLTERGDSFKVKVGTRTQGSLGTNELDNPSQNQCP